MKLSLFTIGRFCAKATAGLGLTLPLLVGFPRTAVSQKGLTDLVIAATTDVHGRLRGWDYYTGAPDPTHSLASAATIVDSLRAANPGRVVLLDAGDLLQGNPMTYVAAFVAPTPVHPVIAAMNVMRYDAATLGNHEFNYGVPRLSKAISQAGFPFVAANVHYADGKPFVAPMTMVTRAGVKVAIIGGTTPGSMVWDRDNLRQAGLTVSDIVPAVRKSVADARRQKADLVVVVLHSGLAERASYDSTATALPSENVAARIPKEIPGVDVVVFGHSHREVIDTTIAGALVIQPRNWAGSVGVATISMQRVKGRWQVNSKRGERVLVAGHVESPAVLAAFTGTHENTKRWVQTAVGTSKVAWRSDSARVTDVPIMDLVAEVMRKEAKTDLAAVSAFSLDATLPAGEITRAMIARLYPYDNTLRAIKLTGLELREFLEHSSLYYRTVGEDGKVPANGIIDRSVAGYNFDMVTGVDYVLDIRQPPGKRVTKLLFRGQSVQPTDTFTMAVNNYRQSGGGGYSMLANAPVIYERDTDIRQLIIDEIERSRDVDPSRYFTANWTIEPVSLHSAIMAELRPQRQAEATGRASGSTINSTPGQRMLRIIAMSDFHAQLQPRREGDRYVGGAVALNAAIRKAERECVRPACESLVLDAGDLFTGTPASDWDAGRPTVAAMNRMGIAAGALGNHEFDFGQDTLQMRLRELNYSVLGANVVGPDGKRPSWLSADTIVERGGIKIGIVGAAGTHTASSAARRKVAGLTFTDPLPAYQKQARELRAAGAQVIVLVIHDGGRCQRDQPDVCEGDGIDLARRLAALGTERPDAMIMGHAHVNLTLNMRGMPAVEPTSSGRGIAIIDLGLGGDTPHMEIRSVRGDSVGGADPAVDSIVRTAAGRSQVKENQAVATIASDLRRTGSQYALGNLVADAVRDMGGGDIGLMNNGGIRVDLHQGEINFGGVHQISPFGNVLVRIRVRGREIPAMMERTFARGVPDAHVSGLLIDYDPAKPDGQRIVRITTPDGRALDPNRIYSVVMNDYMADDLYMDTQKAAISTEFLPIRDSDALSGYLRKQPQPVRADSTSRIRPLAEKRK